MKISRELWKNGRRIVCYIEKVENEKGITFWVNTGKPSDASCLSWRYNDYDKAAETAREFFYNVVSISANRKLTIV